MPERGECGDADWARYVFHRDGAPGIKFELWYHSPAGIWLVAQRDTVTDVFLRTLTLTDAIGEESRRA